MVSSDRPILRALSGALAVVGLAGCTRADRQVEVARADAVVPAGPVLVVKPRACVVRQVVERRMPAGTPGLHATRAIHGALDALFPTSPRPATAVRPTSCDDPAELGRDGSIAESIRLSAELLAMMDARHATSAVVLETVTVLACRPGGGPLYGHYAQTFAGAARSLAEERCYEDEVIVSAYLFARGARGARGEGDAGPVWAGSRVVDTFADPAREVRALLAQSPVPLLSTTKGYGPCRLTEDGIVDCT